VSDELNKWAATFRVKKVEGTIDPQNRKTVLSFNKVNNIETFEID
jgi:hypothetical protein